MVRRLIITLPARACTRHIIYVIVARGRRCVGHVQIQCTYVYLSKTSVKSRESCRAGDNQWPCARLFWKIKNPNNENTMGFKARRPRGRRKSDRKSGPQRGHCTTVFRVEVNEEITRLSSPTSDNRKRRLWFYEISGKRGRTVDEQHYVNIISSLFANVS